MGNTKQWTHNELQAMLQAYLTRDRTIPMRLEAWKLGSVSDDFFSGIVKSSSLTSMESRLRVTLSTGRRSVLRLSDYFSTSLARPPPA
ncbi:hypothetical protein DQ237_11430 [Blastococcus sp. TF02-8]|nr:hypothetical protein DQ237_11430 [Blastococcus sp. TF02-8]